MWADHDFSATNGDNQVQRLTCCLYSLNFIIAITVRPCVFTLVRQWNVDKCASVQQHLDMVQQQQQCWLWARWIMALLSGRPEEHYMNMNTKESSGWITWHQWCLQEGTCGNRGYGALWNPQHMLTLDLLLISEPPDVCGWFAAWRGAGQGDFISLQGRLGESCDLRSYWNSCVARTYYSK